MQELPVSEVLLTVNRDAPDLLLGNPAGARFCHICEANPARASAGFHIIISHQ